MGTAGNSCNVSSATGGDDGTSTSALRIDRLFLRPRILGWAPSCEARCDATPLPLGTAYVCVPGKGVFQSRGWCSQTMLLPEISKKGDAVRQGVKYRDHLLFSSNGIERDYYFILFYWIGLDWIRMDGWMSSLQMCDKKQNITDGTASYP